MSVVGQYEIRELLGAGGIGQVHAAFDTVLEREVAIKSLRPELLNDRNFVERFRGEATSLAKLTHPNITTLHNLLSEAGNLYLIMECVRGETLEELLKKRGGRLGVRESLGIVAQVADGLAYAHSMGVVHRDIKPANVMITASGAVKIMDFGIARMRGSQRLTRDGGALGTLAYMSPEQVRGEEADGRSDLYSLAIMLYEMLSGSVPFEADTDYELMQAHVKLRPQRLSARVPTIDPRLDAALMRALAKNREQRFATVRQFSDALGASVLRPEASKIVYEGTRLIGTPPAAPPPRRSLLAPVLDRMTFVRADLRLPALVGVGAAALLAAALGAVVLLTPIPPTSPRPDTPASSPSPAASFRTASTPLPDSSTAPIVMSPQAANSGAEKLPMKPPPAPAAATSVTPVSMPHAASSPASSPPASAAEPGAKPAAAPTSTPTTLADIIQAAARGDPAAQNALGIKYSEGADGLPRDETKALDWYRKAALQGYAKAETNLGDMYLLGRGGLDKNPLEAFSWYLKAADQNWPDAQYRLGYLYETGAGAERDLQRAVDLYRHAAEGGYPDAQNLLGVLYATGGDGLPQDNRKAVEWYRKAAAQGFAKADKNLGDMYFFGRGVEERDYAKARFWYKKAADQQFSDAQFRLGFMDEKGLGTPPSEEDAIALYKQAARNGSVDAQRALDRLTGEVGGER